MKRFFFFVALAALMTTSQWSCKSSNDDEEVAANTVKPVTPTPTPKPKPVTSIAGQSIGLMEWSDDQSKTWHPASGPAAQTIPPPSQYSIVQFRVKRANPKRPWPNEPFKPEWTVIQGTAKPETFIGDNIGVQFTEVGSQSTTVTAECGNKVTVTVNGVSQSYTVTVWNDDDDDILKAGGGEAGTTTIVGLVNDLDGTPIVGQKVRFSALFADGSPAGKLTNKKGIPGTDALTTDGGYAKIFLTTGRRTGKVQLRAQVMDSKNKVLETSDISDISKLTIVQ